ncbi:hypothetical protein GCM10025868_07030 [Angustibacter aerolatus]|uniref:Gamma-glutamyltranspeptidase n=1 Tax=Angustibacter aerolatus TaxID=1162965 RepID=A0ABQ6JB90_9ACTN|nr:hypothetical protein GCM10025868_07030 [Angustibacter aerolatus]
MSRGTGGAVASVDDVATKVGVDVLARGGNAADAAVAVAATLGVTEPYSSGIGGGGFLVYYDAKRQKISTVDGRENAPRSFTPTTFTDGQGDPLDFTTVVNSGLSVGVPGTPALWDTVLRRWGTRSISQALRPAQQVAQRGFVVDQTFHDQTAANATRFARFPATAEVYLPGGQAPAVGSTFRNPDLARAYAEIRRDGVDAVYRGRLGRAIVQTARHPQTADGSSVYPGQITTKDLRAYRAKVLKPTRTTYRGLGVYGMPVPSSGGIAVGEALNLLEAYDRQTGRPLWSVDDVQYLHRFAEATATAFADRGRWVGDVRGVPTKQLLSQGFANERACTLFDPEQAHARPIPFGSPDGSYSCDPAGGTLAAQRDDHGTTHLTVADRWGNVAAYTLTIEQTGGSGITVPGYGLLLNNEPDRLQLRADAARRARPEPARPRQAAALVDQPDHRDRRPPAGARTRVARRGDDHHHGRPGAHRAPRPRPAAGRRHRCAAVVVAQRRHHGGRAADLRRRDRRGPDRAGARPRA